MLQAQDGSNVLVLDVVNRTSSGVRAGGRVENVLFISCVGNTVTVLS